MTRNRKQDAWQSTMYDETFAKATLASPEFEKIACHEVEFLVRAMGLGKGESLLDAPCGTGRHSRFFARHGLTVTGLDISRDCIRMAEEKNTRKKINYHLGNLLELQSYRGKFDAVVNLFTSFGYFTSETQNRAVLKGLVDSLKPGGRIALHLIDRDWVLENFEHTRWRDEKGVFTLEARKYDRKTRRIDARIVLLDRKSGHGKVYEHSTRLYSKNEMVALLKSCGLKTIQVYGDTDGSVFKKGESSHPVYIGWKI